MYKMILLNNYSSETTWPISNKFNVDPTVETGLRVCSNSHAPLTVMPIYGKIIIIITAFSKPRTAQMMALSLIATTGLENFA